MKLGNEKSLKKTYFLVQIKKLIQNFFGIFQRNAYIGDSLFFQDAKQPFCWKTSRQLCL